MPWIHFPDGKFDVPALFAGNLADIRAQGTPSIVEFLRLDNGTKFTPGEFVTLLNHQGISAANTRQEKNPRSRTAWSSKELL